MGVMKDGQETEMTNQTSTTNSFCLFVFHNARDSSAADLQATAVPVALREAGCWWYEGQSFACSYRTESVSVSDQAQVAGARGQVNLLGTQSREGAQPPSSGEAGPLVR